MQYESEVLHDSFYLNNGNLVFRPQPQNKEQKSTLNLQSY